MSKQTEALKLALEAQIHKAGMNPIMQGECFVMHPEALQKIIEVAIREALAEQPAQQQLTDEKGRPLKFWGGKAEQPAQQAHCNDCGGFDPECPLAQPAHQQEPVEIDVGQLEYMGNSVGYIYQKMQAYKLAINNVWEALLANNIHPDGKTSLVDVVAKHTSPQPSKPWVGLTDEEVKHQWEVWRANAPRYVGFAKGIEAKLKEKNNG